MSKKNVVLATLDQRLFVKELLRLGKLGAELDESFPVYKSGFMRATLSIDASVDVVESPVLKVFQVDATTGATKAPESVEKEETKPKARVARKTSTKSSTEATEEK